MKRILTEIAALLLIAFSGGAQAADGAGVDAGIRMWLNQWTQDAPDSGRITTDNTMLLGPAFEVKFGSNVLLEASYLFSAADYKFTGVIGPSKFDRQDMVISVGYMIIPEFGLSAGYKNSTFTGAEAGTKATVDGPQIGVVLSIPADVALTFHTKLNYLFTRFNEEDAAVSLHEDNPGWSLEFGVRYAFTGKFTGTIGYRYETSKGIDSDVRDSFSGLAFGAMVAL